MLANLEVWCDTWRDNLDGAGYDLKRKVLAALDVAVFLSRRPRAVLPGDDRLAGGCGHQYEICSPTCWSAGG
jgi:hypothetical protein